MKVRSLQVTDFRKFQGCHRVEGFGDGLNLLARENEAGKTSLLQALGAAFFERHRSTAERVQNFRNKVTGNVPEVTCGFEVLGEPWEIWKKFAGQSGQARLTGPNGEVYQGDRAEEKLQELLGFEQRAKAEAMLGVWGALWVQQGLSLGLPALDERARRTIQGCIEAQVGAVTGGERGRKIPEGVRKAKAQLLTASQAKPTGAYADALKKEKELREKLADLTAKREEAAGWLERLAQLDRELAGSRRERAAETMRENLVQARESLREAERQEAAVETLRQRVAAAEAVIESCEREILRRRDLRERADKLTEEIGGLERDLVRAKGEKERTEAEAEKARAALASAREARRLASERRTRASALRRLAEDAARCESLRDALRRAEERAAAEAERRGEAAAIAATDEAVEALGAAERALGEVRAALSVVATQVEVAPEDPAKGAIRLDGAPVRESVRKVEAVADLRIDIDGVGTIAVRPSIEGRDELLRRRADAEAAFRAALTSCGAATPDEARAAHARRRQAERAAEQAGAELKALLKATGSGFSGIDALRGAVASLEAKLEAERARTGLEALPGAEEAEAAELAAEEAWTKAEAEVAEAERNAAAAEEALRIAATELKGVEARLGDRAAEAERVAAELKAAVDALSDEAVEARMKSARGERAAANLQLEQLGDVGAAVAAARVRVERLEKALREHEEESKRLAVEASALKAQLGSRRGIAERIEAVQADLDLAAARAARLREEAEVLSLLDEVLTEAEREAKERYVAPVRGKIMRYLPVLLPGASIEVDEDLSLSGLGRGGRIEAFTDLSHGTREQIAVLTRIAFAELLKDQGRPAMVVLDDALVFSDEGRIERMFDALAQAAQRMQIVVFSCHPTLWRTLGADRLEIRPIANGKDETAALSV
jgi:hypothetical protein